MPVIDLKFDGESDPSQGYRSVWPDLLEKHASGDLIELRNALGVTCLVDGMRAANGERKPSVCLRFDLPDGRTVIAETSLVLFLTAADALRARYGDPRYGTPPNTKGSG